MRCALCLALASASRSWQRGLELTLSVITHMLTYRSAERWLPLLLLFALRIVDGAAVGGCQLLRKLRCQHVRSATDVASNLSRATALLLDSEGRCPTIGPRGVPDGAPPPAAAAAAQQRGAGPKHRLLQRAAWGVRACRRPAVAEGASRVTTTPRLDSRISTRTCSRLSPVEVQAHYG
jgi:hypothetical protein